MVAQTEMVQRIARLTPLSAALAMLPALAHPVAAQQCAVHDAFGLTLAEHAVAMEARPARNVSLRDGWAVRSDDLSDASAYAPVPLPLTPAWMEAGDPLPGDLDAVAPLDAIIWRGGVAEAVAPVVPGEGVLPAGADAAAGALLRSAGTRLRRTDIAALRAAGVDRVMVRAPHIELVGAGAPSPVHDAALGWLAAAIAAQGGRVTQCKSAPDPLDRAWLDPAADAIVVLGGTGAGRRDGSVHALARSGRVAVHGIAISPGETAALGEAEGRPVLLIPGRLDATIAIWLTLGRTLLARLSGGSVVDMITDATLTRKATSSLGLAELVLVQRSGEDGCEPLASGYLSLSALARADGWLLVPPESEGFAAGSRVQIWPLP